MSWRNIIREFMNLLEIYSFLSSWQTFSIPGANMKKLTIHIPRFWQTIQNWRISRIKEMLFS